MDYLKIINLKNNWLIRKQVEKDKEAYNGK